MIQERNSGKPATQSWAAESNRCTCGGKDYPTSSRRANRWAIVAQITEEVNTDSDRKHTETNTIVKGWL